MKYFHRLIFFSVFLFLISNAYIKVYAQIAEIPFELKNDLILIKVQINNDSTSRVFIFDTGASSDLLDSTLAKKIGLKANYTQSGIGANGAKSYDVILNQKLTLTQDIEISQTHLVLSDLTSLQQSLGERFYGIIGYSLLKKFITKIDYDNKKIMFYDKIENVKSDDYDVISFDFGTGVPIPQFNISLTLKNGESFSGKILFDTGAALELLINTPFNEEHKLNEKSEKSLIVTNNSLSRKSNVERIAIQSLVIDKFELGEMVVDIAETKTGVSSWSNYLGILGAKVISRFNIILDYYNYKIYLKPNDKFNKKFEFPLVGFKLKQEGNVVFVKSIDPNCPAYKKGLRNGDKLISVNGNTTVNLESCNNVLEKENTTVNLIFVNQLNNKKDIRLELNKLL